MVVAQPLGVQPHYSAEFPFFLPQSVQNPFVEGLSKMYGMLWSWISIPCLVWCTTDPEGPRMVMDTLNIVSWYNHCVNLSLLVGRCDVK